jgi:Carbonic anhydrase
MILSSLVSLKSNRAIVFGLLFLGLTGCSFKSVRQTHPTALPPAPVQSTPEAKAEAVEMRSAVAETSEHIQKTHPPTPAPQLQKPASLLDPPPPKLPAPPPHAKTRVAGSVPAEKSLGWLKNGNTRFVRGNFRKDGVSKADRLRLTSGQSPHAVVLACSDSRVPPEVIFDQKLGEIFVIRTAGDVIDPNVIRSLDMAVQDLGTNLVVILGSESCPTFKMDMATLEGTDGIAHDLLERSAILRDAVQSGEVKVERALYHLEAGTVEWK